MKFQFAHIAILCWTIPLAAIAIATAGARRLNLPRLTKILLVIGIVLLALCAGEPNLFHGSAATIAVMVDISPSTRGAGYHDHAKLHARLAQLFGPRQFDFFQFSDRASATTLDRIASEEPADRTVFAPPTNVDSIILFSDCQFDPPVSSPQIDVVVDPALEMPDDGAIARLSTRSDERDVTAIVRNHGPERTLAMTGALPSPDLPLGESLGDGTFIFHAARDSSARQIGARISGGDRWPENDALTITPPIDSSRFERWWINSNRAGSRAPTSWRAISANALAANSNEYLSATTIVLDDVSADEISSTAMRHLTQYVHELGGTLMILGGERAFAAGGYIGTKLDAISALSSSPPHPMHRWIFLIDSSGSMSGAVEGSSTSRWQTAVDAMIRALPALPPNDALSVASFAQTLHWWSRDRSVAETLKLSLPPVDVVPNGPTNLQAALESLAARAVDQLPTDLLILSDGEAKLGDPSSLAHRLSTAHIRAHLLAMRSAIDANEPLAQLIQQAGGTIVNSREPARWAQDFRHAILTISSGEMIVRAQTAAHFDPSLRLPDRAIAIHNLTWPKSDSRPLATSTGEVLAAQRRFGAGEVIAMSFGANGDEVDAIAQAFSQLPRDPRFKISWDLGPSLRVTIDAVDANGAYLNDLDLKLTLVSEADSNQSSETIAVDQSGPGRYELSTPSPRTAKVAAIQFGMTTIDRTILPAQYSAEFDAIGNNHAVMQLLAARTGGSVIEPQQTDRIQLPIKQARLPMGSAIALLGAMSIGFGLIHWRRKI